MAEIEVVDLQRLMKADQKAQVFLSGFISSDPSTASVLSQQLRPRGEDWAKVFCRMLCLGFKSTMKICIC